MQLTRLAVFHPVIALTVTMAVVIFGVAAFAVLGLEQNPQVDLPYVTVTATYPGASAQVVEEELTRPIEDAIAGVGNIATITSTSSTSLSTIIVEFQEGVDVDVAASDVQQRISGIRRTLPAQAEDPSYAKLDINDTPILNLAVTGPTGADPTELFRIADDVVRPTLETTSGVGRVVVAGGQEPEVHVEILPDRLQAYGLTINDVTSAIQTQFLSTSAGQATTPDASQRVSVRVTTRGEGLEALSGVSVTSADGARTELRNVATIGLGSVEAEELLRVNGSPATGLLVYKQSDANITQTVDNVRPALDQINAQLPSGYRLELIIDQSVTVRQTVRGVEEELILAALITGLVLFFFLHSFRSTLIVLIAIPLSILIALIVMWLTGLTLNNLTLIALTTSIGVLVDDSIVVLENIFTHLEHGQEPTQAAIEGRGEIGMAAIAITLVDVAVWGPIIVMTGIVGAFLRNFAIVMVAAVLASLLVSFTLTPLLASRWLSQVRNESLLARLAGFWEPAYRVFTRVYDRLLAWSLRHRPVILAAVAVVFASNFLILPRLGTEFIPEVDGTTATVVGELPPGTALDASDRAARRWETLILDKTWFPEVQLAYVQIGRGDASRDPRLITVTMELGEPASRTRTSQEIARAAAEAGAAVSPEMRTRVGGQAGQPIQLRVFGEDLAQLTEVAEITEAALADRPELTDVTNSIAAAPEITVIGDQNRLRDFGLTAQALANALRVTLSGAVVGQWQEAAGEERDIRVRLPENVRSNREAIGSLPLANNQGQVVTIRQVATTTTELRPTSITRVNRQRAATLGAQPNDVPLGDATTAATQTLDGLSLPAGTNWELAGTAQEQQESFTQLALGLGASVLLMFMVLSILYENWLQPLLIQTALPLATVGAFLGLLMFGQTLSVPAFIGIIALFGLVGKNSILLVDRANDLRRQGLDRTTALEQAGASRLRPIIMTSAVLILSMLPVAFGLGDGGEGRAPLGAVLVGGMATSTFLSLLYVPVAYTYFDSLGTLLGRLLRWRPRQPGWRRWLESRIDQHLGADERTDSAVTAGETRPSETEARPPSELSTRR